MRQKRSYSPIYNIYRMYIMFTCPCLKASSSPLRPERHKPSAASQEQLTSTRVEG